MRTRIKERTGSALLAVLGVVAVVSIVCGMLSVTANNQARGSQISRDMLKARMIAESGLNKAYCAVKKDFSLASGYRLKETFDGGSYKVNAVPLPQGAVENRAQLLSEGVYGTGKVIVSVDLENRRPVAAGDNPDNFCPLASDLLVGGTLTLKGNFNAEVTEIHANGNADLGGSASVDNAVISSAGVAAWKKKPASVTLKSYQPARVVYPSELEAAVETLKAHAQANGAVYATGAQVPASPQGGVAYCTGSDAGWSGEGTGCFIFEGPFNSKHVNLTAANNYPALVVLSPSSIQFNAGAVIRGPVILPSSSLKFNGHAAIYGPMIVGQAMTGNGTADFYAGTGGQGFNLPPAAVEQEDNVVITAWH